MLGTREYTLCSPFRANAHNSSLRMVSVQPTTIAQLISEQYMVELHSPTGRDTIFVYLADYVNTPSPT